MFDREKDKDLLLGWPTRPPSIVSQRKELSTRFLQRKKDEISSNVVSYSGDGHLITFAPTGSGKGVSVIIPNLLNYSGPSIVIDPKGENFSVTARYRKENFGHDIILLDPFNSVSDELLVELNVQRDALNPLDLCLLSSNSIENEAQMLANLLAGEDSLSSDPFWDIKGKSLLSALLAFEMNLARKEKRKALFENVVKYLFGDAVYNMAVLLDTHKPTDFVHKTIASFLTITEKTRDGILSTAQSYLTTIMSDELKPHINNSTISLEQIQKRENYTLFIVIPPNKLQSHSSLLKTWVGVLMHTVMERKRLPEKRTLFILDECANLGHLDVLKKAVTLLRGYGLQVWMFFQDISQLEYLYSIEYNTMINNCGVVQAFGISRKSAARPISRIFGKYSSEDITSLDKSQQIVSFSAGIRILRLIKYFKDDMFSGLFDSNPLIKPPSEPHRMKQRIDPLSRRRNLS